MGRGAAGAAAAIPNLVDAADPGRPAGFGPIAAHWSERRRLRGALAPTALDQGIVELPDDMTWEWFQAAPPDQRTPYLHGDEWIVLDGLHPSLPRVQTQLPSARGVARVYLEGRVNDVELVADTLAIDGDAQSCAVVWRGRFALSSEAALATVRIAGALAMPGQPVTWPEAAELARTPDAPAAAALPVVNRPPAPLATTAGLSDEQQAKAGHAVAVPFSPGAVPVVVARPPPETPVVSRAPHHLGSTDGLSFGDHRAAARKAATPFEWESDAPLDGPTAGALPLPEPEAPAEPPTPAEPAPGPDGPVDCPPRTKPAIPIFNRTPFTLVTIARQVRPPQESRTSLRQGHLRSGAPRRRRARATSPIRPAATGTSRDSPRRASSTPRTSPSSSRGRT